MWTMFLGSIVGWIFVRVLRAVMAPGGNLGGDTSNNPALGGLYLGGFDAYRGGLGLPPPPYNKGYIGLNAAGEIYIIPGPQSSPRLRVEVPGSNTYLMVDNAFVTVGTGGNPTLKIGSLIANGGGSAPALGTIGGSGPATAAQAGWLKIADQSGTTRFVPVWS